MKTLTKLELTILAIAVFTRNESLTEVHGTEDGQIFLDANRANLHASTFEKKLKVYPISRGDAEQAAKKENKVEAPKTPKQTVTTEKKVEKKEAKKEVETPSTEPADESKTAKSEESETEDKSTTIEAAANTQK